MHRRLEKPKTILASTRRTQILDAAAIVFAERGFHTATIKHVAQAAGLADGTIYIYFPNKTALLVGLIDRLKEVVQRMSDGTDGTIDGQEPRACFVAYLRKRLELLWSNLHIMQAAFPEILANAELKVLCLEQVLEPMLAIGEEHFRGRINAGSVRSQDVPLLVRTIAGTVFGLLVFALMGDSETRQRWDELPDVVADLLFDGVGK